ncbi:hypothetical protein [Pseudescherichia sp.]|jgi:type IV secretory pathway VirB3-like protein|uniref:hypothetical protein n=1 Tax=Pseudescherichia sp. TaxID=2055881 RepID=UPI0028A21F97|nr:hypothetical protein [Pseudescherichia sp.]MDF2780033.1 hypothetical protein [Enterobacteriaceae bacterium]
MAKGDDALQDAIGFYTQWVYSIASAGQKIMQDEWDRPLFSYLLTKKQLNQLNVICKNHGWPHQTCQGITIYPRYIQHILTSRARDGLNWIQVAELISASFCTCSEIALNKDRNMQSVMLNASKRLSSIRGQAYYGMAILQVSENDLAPVTAYHATEAKIKAIKKK